jgi:hypothetical protein
MIKAAHPHPEKQADASQAIARVQAGILGELRRTPIPIYSIQYLLSFPIAFVNNIDLKL